MMVVCISTLIPLESLCRTLELFAKQVITNLLICKKKGMLILLVIHRNVLLIFFISAINCEWGIWDIGNCSAKCGTGVRNKTRVKIIQEVNGGICNGNFTETIECWNIGCHGK